MFRLRKDDEKDKLTQQKEVMLEHKNAKHD
jgi:hypothetical protein